MPATLTRRLRMEALEDRQLMHGGSLVMDTPVVCTAETCLSSDNGEHLESPREHAVEDQSAVDACFEENTDEQEDAWSISAWGGLAFCVSTALHSAVFPGLPRGYVWDLKRGTRGRHEGADNDEPRC